MSSRNLFYSLSVLSLFLVGWIVWESFTQPGMRRWEGIMEQRAFARNENNTGPIRRVYAVYVIPGNEEEMRAYASQLPYTKYGSTTVYFFSDSENCPGQLQLQEPHFDPVFNASCLAVFEKNSMGQIGFKEKPFN